MQFGIIMENKLKWCFKLKGGLKIAEPNDTLAKSYLEEAKSSLERAEKNFDDHDLLRRIDTQYYMRTGKEEEVKKMLQEAKVFFSMFDNFISSLTLDKVNSYRDSLKKIKGEKDEEGKE